MKTTLLLILSVFLLLSCTKKTDEGDDIKYEVTITPANTFFLSYFDDTGMEITGNNVSSNWSISFKNKMGKPRMLSLVSDPNGAGIATIKIYVNGSVVKTVSSSTPGQYIIAMYTLQ